jgi:HNH endonuclease
MDKLAEKRAKQREYQRAYQERKRNGEGPRPPGKPANTPDVLWSKVDKRGEDECWNWMGYKNEDGYGRVQIKEWSYFAHRVIFNLVNPGIIELNAPKSYDETGFLLHTCDNPSCCNPKHLWVGTHAQNMADKVAKNRQKKFPTDTGPRCKLTMQQAREARKLRKEGTPTRELARRFGVSLPSMKTLIRGDSYKDTENA